MRSSRTRSTPSVIPRPAVVQLPTQEHYVERLIDHIVRSLGGHCPA
ncbi:hypothetical protein AB0M83_11880 [Amycolatopsis sp. NPDC051106]